MMQPTPAPSSAPNSPGPQTESLLETTEYRPPPQNADSAPFAVLVGLFEKLQNERRQERRRKLLDGWFTHWRQQKGYDLYPVLRLLLPQKDRERAVYGLKEKNLAKTYIKLIPLGMRDPDAIRLLNWKKPSERDKSSGDFPNVLYEVVSKRSSVIEGSLSIDDLNDILDDLAKHSGSQEMQSKILQRVYNRSTPAEQRWIVRIILKDMVISVKETTIFSVFHPDAQDLYNTCSDLKKVAYELWDPSFRLNASDKTVQLFHAFAPMLCKRPTKKIEETVREMGGSEFFIEEKLDGERMQLHKRGNEYFYCSRKGKDYTYLYGKHIGTGSLTPYIDKAFDPRIENIILDGEMLVWDPVSERNLPFGTLKTAALDKSKKEHNPRPCFKVFDLVYLNGQSLIHRSTAFRKKNLKACLTEVKGRIELAVEFKGKTAKDIREKMDEVMAARGEGLVIKHPLSTYVLNGRNMDWIKVKPEYMDNMGETVDVLVVAGTYGSGRRSGGVSSLICAVLDDRRKYEDDEEPKYSSFVRIGTGLSFADYVWVRNKPWKPWDPKHPPEFLQTSKRGQEDKGDVYINPEDSFILKVKAAEITPSDQYHIGYTMRFPRALSIRDDLSIADCMPASAVLESLRSEKKRKLESDTGIAKKKRKVVAAKPTILPQYGGGGVKPKDVPMESDLLKGLKFVLFSDPKSRTGEEDKKELATMIYANGGTCAQIAKPGLLVVYGGKTTPYDLKLVINKGTIDVLKPAWITDSIARGTRLPMKKKYFFFASETSTNSEDYDLDTDEDDGPTEDHVSESGPSSKVMDTEETASVTEDEEEAEPKAEEAEVDDPAMAEWFQVDDMKTLPVNEQDEDSVTEADSDNDDVAEVDNEETGLDDWLQVNTEQVGSPGKGAGKQPEVADPAGDVKMGEDENAMEYDEDHIFKHLCFYLDSRENALKNAMPVKTLKYEEEVKKNFTEVAKMITEHGGKIVDLDDPKMTHVVLDKRDDSRRVELIKRTSKPKRRHLVISEFIQACLDEETLLDEEEFMP
ncbi:ATP-dependent DNA ligase [Agrocybe pediades]|nr:ATP-dependent DNA ligase [Agrocybe pediades]